LEIDGELTNELLFWFYKSDFFLARHV